MKNIILYKTYLGLGIPTLLILNSGSFLKGVFISSGILLIASVVQDFYNKMEVK